MFNIEFYLFEQYPEVLAVYIFILGLCIGSFLNVVILRGLAEEEIVKTPSKCPKCGHKLNWYNNIPVLSYVFLLGKCQFCKAKISPQYPIVELITGLMFFAIYWQFGLSFKTLFGVIFASLAIVMSVCDLKEKVIIDWHGYLLIIFGLIYSFLNDVGILWSILGAIIGFIVFELISRIGYLFSESRLFGDGDSIIFAGLGAYFGLLALPKMFITAVLAQTLITIPLFIFNKLKNKDYKGFALYSTLAILLIAFGILYKFNIYSKNYALLALSPILIGLLVCAFLILRSVKNKKAEDLTFLPFGPALVVSGLIMLFL